jgi:hypothetical protein
MDINRKKLDRFTLCNNKCMNVKKGFYHHYRNKKTTMNALRRTRAIHMRKRHPSYILISLSKSEKHKNIFYFDI